MEPVILKLPPDIQRLLFAYCGGVARAATSSVNKIWYAQVLAASRHLSPVPHLYAYTRAQIRLINKALAVDIMTDYHLTVRIGTNDMFRFARQLCIAGNLAVCELAIRVYRGGQPLQSQDVILSRNRQLHEAMSINFRQTWGPDICTVILYMLKHKYEDTILEYFGVGQYGNFMPAKHKHDKRAELAHAIVATKDIRMVRWILQYNDNAFNDILVSVIVEQDAIDLINETAAVPSFAYWICRGGSIRMFTHAKLKHPYRNLIASAFASNNVILFDHLVSIGAPTDHLSFIEGISDGMLECSLRIQPTRPNTREIIHAIVEHGNMELSVAMKHFQFTQEDFNHGLSVCVLYSGDPNEFLQHANNYDIDMYKRYGMVIIDE